MSSLWGAASDELKMGCGAHPCARAGSLPGVQILGGFAFRYWIEFYLIPKNRGAGLELGLLWDPEHVSMGGVCWPCASSRCGTEPWHGQKVTGDSRRDMADVQPIETGAWLSQGSLSPLLWCPEEGLWGVQHLSHP